MTSLYGSSATGCSEQVSSEAALLHQRRRYAAAALGLLPDSRHRAVLSIHTVAGESPARTHIAGSSLPRGAPACAGT
jgi:hypothetical protein